MAFSIHVTGEGIDYTHPAFVNADNTTRIAALWDQTAQQMERGQSTAYPYGTEYSRDQINQALNSTDPYSIVPQRDEQGHGTAMAGIIAGNEMEAQDFSGVVPLATLVVVKLKQAKQNLKDYFQIPNDIDCFQETDLLFGVSYLLQKMQEFAMPMVIYIGVGTNQGSHTGATALNSYLNYYSSTGKVNFVVPAGNETNLGHHVYRSFVGEERYQEIELRVGGQDQGFSMEIWVNSADTFSVGVVSPAGEFTGKIPRNQGNCYVSNLLLERARICTSYEVVQSYSIDTLILLRFFHAVSGNWKIRIYNERMGQGSFHIWLPMQGFVDEDTRFLAPVPETVVCDPGNGEVVITTGAYDHRTGGIYLYSSRGYTADGQVKPTLVSAGVDITAPDIYGGFTAVTGTSAAAAHVAGMSAILWEWGVVERFWPQLRGGDIKRALIMGAERNRFLYPNREFGGYGNIVRNFQVWDK